MFIYELWLFHLYCCDECKMDTKRDTSPCDRIQWWWWWWWWLLWSHVSDLFAVFVVVHAGQRAVGIPVDVCVHATCVSITSPPHITLCTHTHAQFSVFSCRSFSINTLWSWWLIVNERRLKPLSQAASSTHPAGNLSVPLHGAVGVGITGVKGQCSTRLPGEAARCLVTEETRFTASTLVWTLREDSTGLYLLQCYRVSTRGRCLTDTVWADCRSVW